MLPSELSHAGRVAAGRKIIGAVGIAACIYARWVRPRLGRWGATDEEVAGPYPGVELVPEGKRAATMAVTIDVPPDQVWPWLIQMGGDRGGWYSWDRLDNGGRPSATEVHPEWLDLALGDYVKYWRRNGPVDAWEVAALEPNRFLGLRGLWDLRRGRVLDPTQPRPSAYMEGLWAFLLEQLPGGRTRLVISGYQAMRPRWLERFFNYWLYIPVTWPMQASHAGRAQTKHRASGTQHLGACDEAERPEAFIGKRECDRVLPLSSPNTPRSIVVPEVADGRS